MQRIKIKSKLKKDTYIKVDDDVYDEIKNYNWYLNSSGYPFRWEVTGKKKKVLYLHRIIVQPEKNQKVMSKFGDKLDLRRNKLITCTLGEVSHRKRNLKGSSKYQGVCFEKKNKKWLSVIHFNDKKTHIGYFKDEKNAALAYDCFARKYFKEAAVLNFPKISISETNIKHILQKDNNKSSVYRGVTEVGSKWRSRIIHDGKTINLGMFDTAEEAAQMYDIQAKKLKGNTANLNF